MKSKITSLVFTTITFAIFFLPIIYNLDNRLGFDWDQERDAFQIKKQFDTHQPALIGPRVVGPKGFYLGPYFTYSLTPFYFFSNFHPIAMKYYIIFVNLLFFIICITTLTKIYNLKTALIFLFLWSLNPIIVSYETIAWNPILIPIGIMTLWLTLYKLQKNDKNITNWIIFGLNFGIFINIHFQYVFVILFSFCYIFLSRKTINLTFKKISVAIFCLILTFLPLFIFDLRHEFINTRAFLNFFIIHENTASPFTFTLFDPILKGILPFFSYVKFQTPFTIIFYFLVLYIIIKFIKCCKNDNIVFLKSFLFLWIFFPFIFLIWRNVSDYYLYFIYPFLYLFLSLIIQGSKKKNFIFIYLVFLVVFAGSIPILLRQLRNPQRSFANKNLAIKKIKEIAGNKPINVSFKVPLGMDTGYRYLINYYQINQSGKWLADPLVQIVIPPEKENIVFDEIGVDIPLSLREK